MLQNILRRHVSIPSLLSTVRRSFDTILDPVRHRQYSLSDCLISRLALFALKCSSLLEYGAKTRKHPNPALGDNLKPLYTVAKTPSDSCVRERLDVIDPTLLRDAFRGVFATFQRGKGREPFTSLGHDLLSIDGTGSVRSKKVRCASCCTRHHRDGMTTYYHQMLRDWFIPLSKRLFRQLQRGLTTAMVPIKMIGGTALLEEPELKTMHRLGCCWSSGPET